MKKTDAGEYWLTGGYTKGFFLRTTDIFQPKTRSFSRGPTLPDGLYGHCVVRTPAEKFIIIGGVRYGTKFVKTVRQFDFATKEWSVLAPLPIVQSPDQSCHMSIDGKHILVGGK